jgi:hypothetical protein
LELKNEERGVTILDEYDCTTMLDRIRVVIDSPRDPSLTDIMSELYHSGGHMYFDGKYYKYNGEYAVASNERGWFLDLFC